MCPCQMSPEGRACLESSLVNVVYVLQDMGAAMHKLVPLELQYFKVTSCV